MRKLIPFIFVLISFSGINSFSQTDSVLSIQQIEEYELETHQLIKYLEGTLNFIGDPNELPSDKDIIFNQSYLKLFANDKVQVEDDLDENREKPLNKDIQAYLKDVDFFFKEVSFDLIIDTTERIITDSNKIVFKVSLNRHISGIMVNNDTIDNNQLRFVEINLDPYQKDLKIASIYTTKIQEKEELRNWWNEMSPEWKNFFGRSIIVYDTIPLKDIIWFTDSTLVTNSWVLKDTNQIFFESDSLMSDSVSFVADTTLVPVSDTIKIVSSTIYKILKVLRKVDFLDISNTNMLTDLKPVSELTELKELNISNTQISDLYPVRNLKNLNTLICSGSEVKVLSPLKYLSSLEEIDLSFTKVENLTPLSNLKNLKELTLKGVSLINTGNNTFPPGLNFLDISNSNISRIDAINKLHNLSDLNISSSNISDLSGIDSLINLQHLNIDSTYVSDIKPLINSNKLIVLQANNTLISSLKPLNGKTELKIVYCDNSKINSTEANRFMDENPGCMIVYNSKELENWWNGLSSQWKLIFQKAYNIKNPVTAEKLHEIILKKELSVSSNKQLKDIEPLKMMHRLEVFDMSNTSISDISELSSLSNLEDLNMNNTSVLSLDPLSSLRNIKSIRFENTAIVDLSPLEGSVPNEIYCDNSKVLDEDALRFKNAHPEVTIIYQSENLRLWWNSLNADWKTLFEDHYGIPVKPSNENLQNLVDFESISIVNNMQINDLYPLYMFRRLKELVINSTSISYISPVFDLKTIEILDISKNPVSDLNGISNLKNLMELIIKNTPVEDLEPVSEIDGLIFLDISGTKIRNLKYIDKLSHLQKLYMNNTGVKNIKPVFELNDLKYLQCFNTKIKASKIEELKKSKPSVEIIYY